MSPFDLDPASRQALELDELLDWIAGLARSAAGAERVRALSPSADAEFVSAEQAAVAEVRRHLREAGRLLPARLPDHREAELALAVEGLRLDAVRLRELAAVLRAAGELRAALRGQEAASAYPFLSDLARALPDLASLAGRILAGTDPEGRLLDQASPELAEIRSRRRRVEERVRAQLGRMLRDPTAEAVLRDDFITQRNGRFVVPVRADAPRPLAGIVHASSSSGATRFVEPLDAVELNNEIVRLADAEQEEEQRVLAAWSEAFRRRRDDVGAALAAVVRVDALEARAAFAEETGATEPELAHGSDLFLESAVHPLLARRLRAAGAAAVPLTLRLDPAAQVLVLSGPNTGGKTVALKTLGLAALMAQSGIPVTARSARLPLYRQVRADIGDHQSIDADLSTFSAHVRAVAGVLEGIRAPCLLLFDEIGTGTEPGEGAALAQSVLEALLARSVTAVATTHLSALKAWAFVTAGAASAAMEFDALALRPTYRVLQGAAGSSAGLAIASRLGLDPAIVERARQRLGSSAVQAEDYLERLRVALAAVATEREALARQEAARAAEQRALLARLDAEAARRRGEAARELAGVLEELRREGRRELTALTDERQREQLARRLGRVEARLATQAARHEAALAPASRGGRAEDAGWVEARGEVAPGTAVLVRSLGRPGTFVGRRGERLEVKLGPLTLTVPEGDLLVAAAGAPVPTPAPGGSEAGGRLARLAAAHAASGPGPGSAAAAAAPGRELVLIGQRVEEALEGLDRFLDAAVLQGWEEIRIVHGHGSGRLRAAVRRFLASHAQVRSQRPGEPREGGEGATVVTLR